jgi:hypothetical protein
MLNQRKPKISEALKKLGLNTEVFTIQWFVCLFANTLPQQVRNLLSIDCGDYLGSFGGLWNFGVDQDGSHNYRLVLSRYSRSQGIS